MLISLNWLRDFVDLPADVDAEKLAERFTMTCAEVEGVERIEIPARGLLAGQIIEAAPLANSDGLSRTLLDIGSEKVETVTAAAGLQPGRLLVYAPPGTKIRGGQEIGKTTVAGQVSVGMILPAEAIGLDQAAGEAVFLPPGTKPGAKIVSAGVLDDWVIEVDNKSITHRPDLWGHYGIAREIAAMLELPLKGCPMVDEADLCDKDLPEIPITIDDPIKCPRYSGLMLTGVRDQPSPLWMQARLSHVGIRPINLLVDLTNYIMAELGQPMHAFDAAHVERIEVAVAKDGEKFTTLDGMERTMPEGAVMIQANRKSVALAGIMGGADTEVTEQTTRLLLESANFDGATIRRCATALSHRTEASARFEKSQDPTNTVLAIRRFVSLARSELPEMALTSRLSDCFPAPPAPVRISIDYDFLNRYIGREVSRKEVTRILEALSFEVTWQEKTFDVVVPSFRATKDVTIEADVIEEVARFVGYDQVPEALPRTTIRYFRPNALHQLQRRCLELLCEGLGFVEIHSYIWHDDDWLHVLGHDPGPCIELQNPSSSSTRRLRESLVPHLLQTVVRNRHHFNALRLVDVGAVFAPEGAEGREERHLVVALAVNRRQAESELLAELKAVVEQLSRQLLDQPVRFRVGSDDSVAVWEDSQRTAVVEIAGEAVGRVTVVPQNLRRKADEHLTAWGIVVAELNLSSMAALQVAVASLEAVPAFPRKDLDFSFLTEAGRKYADLAPELGRFEHPLLVRLSYVGNFEGKSLPPGKRSLTVRALIGRSSSTLTQQDIDGFREAFESFLTSRSLEMRS